MKNSKTSIVIIVVVLVLAVGFVFVFRGRNSTPEQAVQAPTQAESVNVDVIEDTAVPAVEEATIAPTAEQQAATEVSAPKAKEGLEATDPATVQLASGEIQLIEAFAFW